MRQQPRSILVIDLSPFGRSLSLLPMLRALRSSYSGTRIAAATSPGACELAATGGLGDAVIDLGITQSSARSFFGAVKRISRIVRGGRNDKFDLVLDLSPRLETQMASRLVSGGRVITPVKFPAVLDVLLAGSGRPRRSADHLADCESVLRQLGLRMTDRRLGVTVGVDGHARFEDLLVRSGSRGGEFIVAFYSGAVGRDSGWPVERFAEIAVRLSNNYGARVLAMDEPTDQAFTKAIGGMLPQGAIKLVTPRALEVAAAVARSSLVVTDDSGLAQLASEFDTPVLEISESRLESPSAGARRTVHAASRARVTADEAYEVATEMLLMSRTVSLIQR